MYDFGVPAKFMASFTKLKALNRALTKLAKVVLTSLHLYYFLVEHYLRIV